MIKTIAVLATLATVSEAVPEGEWTTIEMQDLNTTTVPLAAQTSCGVDKRYAFGAYRGTSNKLVIQFQGGGICFNEETCINTVGVQGATCIGNQLGEDWSTPIAGMQNKDPEKNLLAEWNHIYLPYCTCDFFYGTNLDLDLNFGQKNETAEFSFAGYSNAKAMWQWVKAYYQEEFGQESELPESILVTGCSAGGYGASVHLSYIAEDLKDTDVDLMFVPDSSYGNVDYLFPATLPFLFGLGITENPIVKEWVEVEGSKKLVDLHLAHVKEYPNLKISSFGFAADNVIRQDAEQLLMSETFANVTESADGACRVNSWVVDESVFDHCVISTDKYYDVELPSGKSPNQVIGEFAENYCTVDDLPEAYLNGTFPEKECADCAPTNPGTPTNPPTQFTFAPFPDTSDSAVVGGSYLALAVSMLVASVGLL